MATVEIKTAHCAIRWSSQCSSALHFPGSPRPCWSDVEYLPGIDEPLLGYVRSAYLPEKNVHVVHRELLEESRVPPCHHHRVPRDVHDLGGPATLQKLHLLDLPLAVTDIIVIGSRGSSRHRRFHVWDREVDDGGEGGAPSFVSPEHLASQSSSTPGSAMGQSSIVCLART